MFRTFQYLKTIENKFASPLDSYIIIYKNASEKLRKKYLNDRNILLYISSLVHEIFTYSAMILFQIFFSIYQKIRMTNAI